MRTFLVGLLLLVSCRCADALPPAPASGARLELWAKNLSQPVGLVALPGAPLVVVEKTGTLRRISADGKPGAVILDLSDRVSRGGEQGLLGLAVHPKFPADRRIFVNYTDLKGDTRIVEYRLGENLVAIPESARELLFLDQPYSNHNGGHLVFGPDGKLYVGTGDGGAAWDPQDRAQNDASLFGKMLVIDVDAERAVPRKVAKGLRNPWRYAFDRETGDLFIADVGQNRWEWVHVVPKGTLEGRNFGWDVVEGSHCRNEGCDKSRFTLPVVEYSHDDGCSITGGIPYRGAAIPSMQGVYLYTDFCSAILRGFRWKDGKVVEHRDWKNALDPNERLTQPSAFGVDAAGELYVTSLAGPIWKLVPAK